MIVFDCSCCLLLVISDEIMVGGVWNFVMGVVGRMRVIGGWIWGVVLMLIFVIIFCIVFVIGRVRGVLGC